MEFDNLVVVVRLEMVVNMEFDGHLRVVDRNYFLLKKKIIMVCVKK
jgi:hypothetical protein